MHLHQKAVDMERRCHCANCRKVAGGIFGVNLTIEKEKVQIEGEEHMKIYDVRWTLSLIASHVSDAVRTLRR